MNEVMLEAEMEKREREYNLEVVMAKISELQGATFISAEFTTLGLNLKFRDKWLYDYDITITMDDFETGVFKKLSEEFLDGRNKSK
jgi:hypothetical protein